MIQITFTLRTLTPLFLAGADQTKAELRPPAFRGLMRYWWRTILGNLAQPDNRDMQPIIDREKQVFGATDRGSPVRVRILNPQQTEIHQAKRRDGQSATGRDYLLWSALLSNRPYISSQAQFQVALSVPSYDESQGKEALKCAVSSFWLLTHLGGLGTRARRGAGSLSVIDVQGDTFDFPFDTPASVADLQAQLEQGLSNARKLAKHTFQGQKSFFDTLAPATCRIWILTNKDQAWPDADQVLQDVGQSMRNYRSTLHNIEDHKIFGIPVMVLNQGKAMQITLKGAGKEYKRMASPIHLRISEIRDKHTSQYVCIATLFKTKWDDMTEEDYQQLYQLIEQWIKQGFPQAKEVTF